ncbi:hypothetical protein MCAP1_002328 [Malassezia caprae]|uniref:BHLH domain-containing protein n=1 Tax=Malassezia caprae TaxID=1381934 RepID=A0AAF0E856_9BASI|nr:hypothetical protein MCAP1_002328 [Malassezia caprae]
MHAATNKPEGGDLAFQSGHPPAYSHGEGKKDAGDHSASMDPNLTGARRAEGAQSGYPNVRQEQQSYRLDLLQTDPNLDSNASLPGDSAEADHVSRAFPFLSNTMAAQDGDGRASIFPHNFSGVSAAESGASNLAYKKSDADALTGSSGGADAANASLHGKAPRGSSYDAMVSEKKETPYSRSPSLRVTHKIAERKRRKEMKDLFDELKDYVPVDRGPKTSKGDILTKAVLQFQTLHREREQLIEALEAAHQELNHLRQVTGSSEHAGATAGGLPQHVYSHSGAPPASYLPRGAADARLHEHLPLGRNDKGEAAAPSASGVGINNGAPRSNEFLSDLRLDRLRQPDDNVHPNFKQLEQGTGVLDQSLGGTRSFQPDSYQGGLVSELPSGQEAPAMGADAGR